MTSYPFWVTAGTLPTRAEGYSYSSNPEILIYGETNSLPCTVSIPPINGSLPPGTRVEFNSGVISILGQISGVPSGSTTYSFTLRLSNGTYSTDRTFYISATNSIDILEWLTPENSSLGYYFESGAKNYQVLAQNTPSKPITYTLAPYLGWTQGLSIENNTGLITLDLSWKPNWSYTTLDLVWNRGYLYQCVVAGTSGLANGPYITGAGIVDSIDSPWTPNTYYVVNQVVTNDSGKIYVSLSNGFSGVGVGPSGTGGNIPDAYPLAWKYIGQAAVWDQITPGTIVPLVFAVTAQNAPVSPTQTQSRLFRIDVISTPHPPIWQTPSGSIGETQPGDNFLFQLEVFDPDYQGVTFTATGLPAWLNLGTLGELWGQTPALSGTTVYSFTITASDGVFSVPRTFTLTAVKDPQQIFWQTPNQLGSIPDGEFSSIQFLATTTRTNASISYGLRGGMIPPNTTVVSSTGMLSGFVEYHPISKTYFFEIGATDGTELVTRWFSLTVASQNCEKYLTISIPITGTEKLNFITNNSTSIIGPEYLYREADKNWSRNDTPEITVVDGLKYTTVEQVKNTISNWLTEFTVSFGNLQVSNDPTLSYQTLFITVRDSSSVQPWQPFTSYHSQTRVSTSEGLELLATVGGESGDYPEPKGAGNDGSVVWQFVDVPNTTTGRAPALPWYPSHQYSVNQTVVNIGEIFKVVNPGVSAGGLGPTPAMGFVTDGSVTWNQSGVQGPNFAYPPSVFNIRRAAISTYGFASGKGTGALGFANINLATTGVSSITVVDSGYGYYSQPSVTFTGNGSGAELTVRLKLVTATLITSGAGFSVGTEFTVSQGLVLDQNPGIIAISSVNSIGQITGLTIQNSGSYSQFPKSKLQFRAGNSTFEVFFDLGVKSVSVDTPGAGYDDTTRITFSGSELLPAWQEHWTKGYVLSVPLANITYAGASSFKNTPFLVNPYDGTTVEVKQIKLTVQGLVWSGTTSFDDSTMTWDTDLTRCVEFEPASETDFDNNFTVFDRDTTWFDHGEMGIIPWSQTVFDHNTTILDYYATLVDARASITSSRFAKSYIVNFGKPWQ